MKRILGAITVAVLGLLAFVDLQALAQAVTLYANDAVGSPLPAGEYRETTAGSYGGRGAQFYTSESGTDGAYVLLEGSLSWKPGYGGNARLDLQGLTDGVQSSFSTASWECEVTTTGGSVGASLIGEKLSFADGEGFSVRLVNLPDGDTYYDVDYSCTVEFQGQMTPDHDLRVQVIHNGQFSSDLQGTQAVMWLADPPTPVDYCPDGVEALSSPTILSPTQVFSSSVTGFDWQRVRYLFQGEGGLLEGRGWINYANKDFTVNSGVYTYSLTVPSVSGSVPGPYASLQFENNSDAAEITLLSACVREAAPQEYCPNGIEMISGTVHLEAGDAWSDSATTPWNLISARYTFTYPEESTYEFYQADLTLNDVTQRRDWMQTLGAPALYHNEIVPNTTDPAEDDYLNPSFVTGPDATASVVATDDSDDLYLVSVCVEQMIDTSEYCSGGTELLSTPVYLEEFGSNRAWSGATSITSTHIVARFVVEDPNFESADVSGRWDPSRIRASVGFDSVLAREEHYIDYTRFQTQPMQYITATLPNTGSIRLFSSNLTVDYRNQGEPHILRSVCIVDAPDDSLSLEDCRVYNPDFANDIGGANNWTGIGDAVWSLGLDLDGIMTLNSMGGVSQTAQMQRGDVVRYEALARSVSGSKEFEYGSDTTSLLSGGPQLYTETLVPLGAWWLIQKDIYFQGDNSGNASEAYAYGDGVEVDYICLRDSASLYEEVDCLFPEWDPPTTEGILSGEFWNFVYHWLGRVMFWMICEVAMMLNSVTTFIRDLLMAFPALPDESGLISWLEWIGLVIARLGDYLGGNLTRLASWFPRNGENLARWFIRFVLEILAWILEQFGIDAGFLVDLRDIIYLDLLVFLDNVATEIELEFNELVRLLQNTADVFLILINGFSGGVSGTEIAPLGQDMGGVADFIWAGVDFFNEAIQGTPLVALNVLALGILAFGLGQWTLQKFLSMLEALLQLS